jgi:hypothetical protein
MGTESTQASLENLLVLVPDNHLHFWNVNFAQNYMPYMYIASPRKHNSVEKESMSAQEILYYS